MTRPAAAAVDPQPRFAWPRASGRGVEGGGPRPAAQVQLHELAGGPIEPAEGVISDRRDRRPGGAPLDEEDLALEDVADAAGDMSVNQSEQGAIRVGLHVRVVLP